MAEFTQIHKPLFQWIKDSRWRKKCKTSIKRARYQIFHHTNRMKCIIKQSRGDIARLISLDDDLHQALPRVESLHYEEAKLSACRDIDDFLVKIKVNLSQFTRKVDDLGLEIHEAVSCVISAASLCGELAELRRIRELFVRWFGDDFRRLNENFVNCRIKCRLSEESVPEEVKLWLVVEISKEYSINIDRFEVIKLNKYQEISTRNIESPIEPVSVILDKNKRLVTATKMSIFHQVFQRLHSKFSFQARSSKLVIPHRDSFDDVSHAEEVVKKKYEADNKAIIGKGPLGESFMELKEESNNDHLDIERFIELKDELNNEKLCSGCFDDIPSSEDANRAIICKGLFEERLIKLVELTVEQSHRDFSDNVKEKNEACNKDIVGKELLEDILIELKDETSIDQKNVVTNNNDNEDAKENNIEVEKPRLSYIHPKLPDYDKLVATFEKYKKEFRENNFNNLFSCQNYRKK